MKLAGFGAAADIVGRRVKIAWEVVPEEGETVADAPDVVLRRKLRDFTFPDPDDTPFSFVVYDSETFPPTDVALRVVDLPGWEVRDGAVRTAYSAISVSKTIGGRFVEVLRRTVGTTFAAGGAPLKQRVEILDLGGAPGALAAGVPLYYELIGELPAADAAAYRAIATPGEAHGINRNLYDLLPAVYRRHDVANRPPTPGAEALPEAAPRSGQLRRFIDLFGSALDSMRSSADALRALREVDNVDARWLRLLGQWIGWDLGTDVEIPLQRNEIRSAPRLYRTVGTVPGLRAIVTHYTGWFTQVAEYAQHIYMSNQAPRLNIFASVQAGNTLEAVDDARARRVIWFANGDDVYGTGLPGEGTPAVLSGGAAEPFALRPGMTFTITVDGGLPVSIRFEAGDFDDIRAAEAAEVAAVLGRTIPGISAHAVDGELELRTISTGSASSLRVEVGPASLVTLEAAPRGRLSTFLDSNSRTRLFYETVEGSRQVHYKTLADELWRDARPMPCDPTKAHGCPAAIEPTDVTPPAPSPVWVAWVEQPETRASRLRFLTGLSRAPQPARLFGRRHEPFALVPESKLRLTGDWGGFEDFIVHADDFDDPGAATAQEVMDAAAGLTHVRVLAQSGTIRLESAATGDAARLDIDFSRSTMARALGFTPDNGTAHGSWSDEIDWGPTQFVTSVPPGRYSDLAATPDYRGGVRLFWSQHDGRSWRIRNARWDGNTWVASSQGAFFRAADGTWGVVTTADGLPSNDVRAVALDADGAIWFATNAGVSMRGANGVAWSTWDVLTIGSNDVRDVAVHFDGSVWVATGAGVAMRLADGTGGWVQFTTADGLISNNVQTIVVDAGGAILAGGEGGVSAYQGSWTSLPTSAAMPVRAIWPAEDGSVWVATGSGVLRRGEDTVRHYLAGTVASSDTRDVAVAPDGTAWVATAAGVSARFPDGTWRSWSTPSGLQSGDVRAISIAPDGAIWAATAAGVAVRRAGDVWTPFSGLGEGPTSGDTRSIHGPWSAPGDLSGTDTSSTSGVAGASDRELCVVRDEAKIWLIWSQQQHPVGNGTWLLKGRRFDRTLGTWDPEFAVTTIPANGRVADREPSVIRAFDALALYFTSDRATDEEIAPRDGVTRLWQGTLITETASNLMPFDETAARDHAPAPMQMPSGEIWLLFRSDRSVPLSQVGSAPLGPGVAAGPRRSILVPDAGSLRRHCGSTSVVVNDIVRNRQRRKWDDLMSYTPQKPDGAPLTEEELYARNTIGLHITRGPKGNPFTEQEAARLRQLLERFLPINIRAVLFLAPPPVVEDVGANLADDFQDVHPFADMLTTLGDAQAAELPEWRVLESNTAGDVSADPDEPTTLRGRTFYEPPE